MSYKEKLRKMQGTSSDIPKLEIIQSLEMKADEKDKASFSWWDKENEERKYSTKQIEGIFIGSCMRLSAYSDDLGPKGGNYVSDYYFNRNNIVLFEPTSKGYRIAVKGNMDEVEAFITANAKGNPRKFKVIFILTSKGLIAVSTNLSIAIDQLNQYDRDIFIENKIILIPTLYSPETDTITNRGKKYLGKFASKNPPKYAEIMQGTSINEKEANELNIDKVLDEYEKWVEFKIKGGVDEQEQKKVKISENDSGLPESELKGAYHGKKDEENDNAPPHTKDNIPF